MILGTIAMFGPFGTDVYLSGFTQIAEDLHTSVSQVQLTLSVYFFGLAVGQIIYGPLTDRFGRLLPLYSGLFLFTAGSIAVALTPSIHFMLVVRVLQALGGCVGMIVSRAVVRDLFDLKGSASMLSTLAIVQSLGPIIAPVLGSFMISVLPWRSVFFLSAAFGIFCFIETYFGLPETLPPEKRTKGAFSQVFTDYWRLLSNRAFIVPASSSAFAMSAMFAYISGSSFIFMHIYGAGARTYGLIFAANAFGMMFSASLNRKLLRHFEPHQILTGAFAAALCVVVGLIFASGSANMWVFFVFLWLSIAAMPLVFANSIAIALEAGRERAGSASALIGVFQFLFASVSSMAVSFFDNGTAHVMPCVMLGGVALGGIVHLFAPRKKSAA
jgi:DHA1 family bicyclomycin/chloramphenicol resistance-like MFS transporter